MTPGRNVPIADAADPAGAIAGLFQQLALGGLLGRFAGVDRARRDFEQRLADRIAVGSRPGRRARRRPSAPARRPAVDDHLALGGRPVARAVTVCRARSIFRPRKITRRRIESTSCDPFPSACTLSACAEYHGSIADRSSRSCIRGSARPCGSLRSRMVRTGQGASRTMRSATEPRRTWLKPGPAVGGDDDQVDPLVDAHTRRSTRRASPPDRRDDRAGACPRRGRASWPSVSWARSSFSL